VADATFQEVFDWLAARESRHVYIDVGAQDPQVKQRADFSVLGLQARLGAVRMVDETHGRGALRVLSSSMARRA
jgi:hypothetical protein